MTALFPRAAALALVALAVTGCARGGAAESGGNAAAADSGPATIAVTVKSANGAHVFAVEIAKTPAQQERGLMYRTDLKPDGGMLFWPYPAAGGGPKEANFWMKNTPSPLDIIFIRADRTIAHIAENTVPFSGTLIPSGEPVAAVLEIPGGRASDLGISEGDSASWGVTPAK